MSEQRCQVSGELDVANANELRSQLLSMVRETQDDLVLDCDDLSFIDKFGIGVFTSVSSLLAREHRHFRVVNLHGNPRRKVERLGLMELLAVERA